VKFDPVQASVEVGQRKRNSADMRTADGAIVDADERRRGNTERRGLTFVNVVLAVNVGEPALNVATAIVRR